MYALSMDFPDEHLARRFALRAANFHDLAEKFEIAEAPEPRAERPDYFE